MSGKNGGYQSKAAPVRFPRILTCVRCKRTFVAVEPQEECIQCMIKPSRIPSYPSITKEQIMPTITSKEKTCVDCQKPFKPTGNCQKRCPECLKLYKPWTKPGAADKPPLSKVTPKAVIALRPTMSVTCTMQDTVAIFHALADAGCSCLVFGNTKITIEAL